VTEPAYYPCVGYRPASHWKITTSFEVPDEAHMVLELVEGGLDGVSGEIAYAKDFFEKA
jgi:predicted N-acetyltransferase YhbS